MGCGCGGGVRSVGRRPIITPRNNRSVSRGIPRSARQLRALEAAKSTPPPVTARQLAATDAQGAEATERSIKRAQIERKRRMAIAARKK